jgi:adenosylcobinamide-GDP ribazoletransferase
VETLARSLTAAFSYFSILPVRGSARAPAPDANTLAFLPVVGAVIGALAGCGAYAVSLVAPHGLVVATAFALVIVLSGAIHVDGFLDCSDAVFASVTPTRRLEIMKDPARGAYAIAAMAVITVVWLAALGACPSRTLPFVLAFSGALTRVAAVWNARWFAYAPGRPASSALAERPSLTVLMCTTLALLVGAAFIAPWAWLIAPFALIASFTIARAIASRLGGGLVGDAYGFLIVCLEPAIVAVLAVLVTR